MKNLKWLVIVLLLIFLLIFLIIITKLTILLTYQHSKDNDQLTIKFKIWFGLIRYKISVPLIKMAEDSPSVVFKKNESTGGKLKKSDTKDFTSENLINGLRDTKEMLQHVISLEKIVRKFLKRVSLKQVEWHSVIGIGDAAKTGTLTGALWSVKGGLIGLISHYVKLKGMPIISITPNFQKATSETRLRCMIQFRIGNAMLAGIKLIKYWKGGRPTFKSNKLSFISRGKSKTI